MQASKVTMRMPTLLPFGEGSNERGKQSTRAPARSAGVVGTARRKGGSGNRGRPVSGEGSVLNVAEGNGHDGSRTGSYERRCRVMPAEQRALTFWHASGDGEVKVIGDEPANTDYDPGPSVEAHTARRRYVTCRGVVARHQHRAADRRGPCGEANRKAECRKSARSV